MEQNNHIFIGGMNKDASDALLKPTQYRDARNFRLMSSEDGNTGSLENIIGNTVLNTYFWSSNVYKLSYDEISTIYPIDVDLHFLINGTPLHVQFNGATNLIDLYKNLAAQINTFGNGVVAHYSASGVYIFSTTIVGLTVSLLAGYPSEYSLSLYINGSASPHVIGGCSIGGYTYVFTCDGFNNGQIFKVRILDSTSIPTATWSILYNGKLNFSEQYPIRKCIPWDERQDVQKIYFTDNHNYLRVVNVLEDNLFAKEAEMLDIIPDIEFSNIMLSVAPNGFYGNGKIQYAYQCYNIFGQESLISPLSKMIHLTKSLDRESNTFDYFGSAEDLSNKAVNITINNVDRRFDRIKIYAVFYEELYGVPEVNVVYDNYISNNGVVSFTDKGNNNLEAVNINDFNTYGNVLFRCKDINSLHNFLIPANIQEEFFDVTFDARAYRFKKGSADTYVDVDFADLSTWGVPLNHDAINPSQQATNGYFYQLGSNIFGGTGPNVSYEFTTVNFIENAGTSYNDKYWQEYGDTLWSSIVDLTYSDNHGYTGYASPNHEQFRSYQRGETYRFGVVFYSKKGRASFVHWIGDIKMPKMGDMDGKQVHMYGLDYRTFYLNNSDLNTYVLPLGIKFTINIPDDISDEISGYEIVRVQRKSEDRTVLMQGLVPGPVTKDIFVAANVFRPHWRDDDYTTFVHPRYVDQFISPDVNINKNIIREDGDYLQYCMWASGTYQNLYDSPIGKQRTYRVNASLLVSQAPPNEIDGAKFVEYMMDPSACNNVFQDNEWKPLAGYKKGSSIVIKTRDQLIPNGNNQSEWTSCSRIYNYCRNITNQYGGNTYSHRLSSEYISCGGYYKIYNSGSYVANIFGGDVYISVFDYLNFMTIIATADTNDVSTATWENYLVPLESFINCNMRNDSGSAKMKVQDQRAWLQENAGVYEFSGGEGYNQTFSLYIYNSVFSRENDLKTFYPKPYYINSTLIERPTTILSSQQKKDDEIIDSFCQFLPLDRITIGGAYGEINGLCRFKNTIYCFQDSAVGVPSVQDRSIISDNTGQPLVLGSGGVLSRYDYISTTTGTRHQFSIIPSNHGVYYYDSNSKNINILNQEDTSISETYGMKAWLNNNVPNDIYQFDVPTMNRGMVGYFDRRYNEIVFTILSSGNQKFAKETLCFSEPFKCFTSFYDFAGSCYIITEKNYILHPYRTQGGGDALVIQNFGNPCEFYGEKQKSTLHLVENSNYAIPKTMDSFAIVFESFSNGVNIFEDFFNRIRCYNNYQNTDWNEIIQNQPLTPFGKFIECDRRERTWRMHFPRNFFDKDIALNEDIFDPNNLTNISRLFKERLRSQSVDIQFEYDNDDNNLIKIPIMTITYRFSIR